MSPIAHNREWIETRLRAHRRYLTLLAAAWAVSLVGVLLLFLVILPWLAERLPLPEEIVLVLAVGVVAELLTLLYMTLRVDGGRRRLRRELDKRAFP